MTTATAFDIIDLCDSGEEPNGFAVMGHVDIDAFRAACIARQRDEHGLDEDEVDPLDLVEHAHYVAMPSSYHELGAWVAVDEDWLGATAITIAHMDGHRSWTVERELERQAAGRAKASDERRADGDRRLLLSRAEALLKPALDALPDDSLWAAATRILLNDIEGART